MSKQKACAIEIHVSFSLKFSNLAGFDASVTSTKYRTCTRELGPILINYQIQKGSGSWTEKSNGLQLS